VRKAILSDLELDALVARPIAKRGAEAVHRVSARAHVLKRGEMVISDRAEGRRRARLGAGLLGGSPLGEQVDVVRPDLGPLGAVTVARLIERVTSGSRAPCCRGGNP
jgi:hypothetical protein